MQAALDRAARDNPTIYKPQTQPHQHQPGGSRVRSPAGGGVSYPEEYEGNEPMDESWAQQPLEPTDAPSLSIGTMGDNSGLRGSGRWGSRRRLSSSSNGPRGSTSRRMSRSHREDEDHFGSSAKRHSVRE